jgi:hypothetical protein
MEASLRFLHDSPYIVNVNSELEFSDAMLMVIKPLHF